MGPYLLPDNAWLRYREAVASEPEFYEMHGSVDEAYYEVDRMRALYGPSVGDIITVTDADHDLAGAIKRIAEADASLAETIASLSRRSRLFGLLR